MSGPDNMALDEALLARARRTGERVLRVYSWLRPTLSLGRNQRARDIYDLARARALGIDVVRRITGGRALLHHREVTYSVTAPAGDDSSLMESYVSINSLLASALRSLGVPVTAAPRVRRMPPPGSAPCFELPAPGELVFAGRKLVGSAQFRDGGAFLQHGSILIDDDQGLIGQLAIHPVPLAARAATLREALGRAPSVREVADALFAAARASNEDESRPWLVDATTRSECAAARARYESEEWTLYR
jgi:lipoate-protein ligase A